MMPRCPCHRRRRLPHDERNVAATHKGRVGGDTGVLTGITPNQAAPAHAGPRQRALSYEPSPNHYSPGSIDSTLATLPVSVPVLVNTAAYQSADSAPSGYAVRRPVWLGGAFLATFLALTAAVNIGLPRATTFYARLLSSTSGTPYPILLKHASVSFRPFILTFVVLLGVFAPGSLKERARFVGSTFGAFLVSHGRMRHTHD